jgi:hypothetical protein
VTVQLHLAKDALALHLLLQNLKGLVDIVVAYENLHSVFLFGRAIAKTMPRRSCRWRMDIRDSAANGGHDTPRYWVSGC